ncbi:hypothetical protein [Rodentibacter pneumotropicus]|nr:hypothetical protein [Rodentibacter pneumotropicus]
MRSVFDSLAFANVIGDDSLINKLMAEKFSPVKDGKVVVRIKAL